jgi:uncharacterized protein (TIGR03089 family)
MTNAVAKAAGYLRDDLGLGPGDEFSVDLPRHWQLPVWVLAALSVGASCGRLLPQSVVARIVSAPQAAAGVPGTVGPCDELLISACDAFGLPVPGGVPAGAVDVALEVRTQPDSFVAAPEASARASLALAGEVLPWSAVQARVVAAHPGLAHGARLWVDEATPDSEVVAVACVLPLALDGSVVLASGLGPEQAAHVRTIEGATPLW